MPHTHTPVGRDSARCPAFFGYLRLPQAIWFACFSRSNYRQSLLFAFGSWAYDRDSHISLYITVYLAIHTAYFIFVFQSFGAKANRYSTAWKISCRARLLTHSQK